MEQFLIIFCHIPGERFAGWIANGELGMSHLSSRMVAERRHDKTL
jgi:hypothetical protein